mmetsp:Transcript_26597/g.67748  ORF Transcript_26597/g.67748 Transcript_26597/m.67748 type:complete len:278 (-) Transcript_26597:1626-2459(-)
MVDTRPTPCSHASHCDAPAGLAGLIVAGHCCAAAATGLEVPPGVVWPEGRAASMPQPGVRDASGTLQPEDGSSSMLMPPRHDGLRLCTRHCPVEGSPAISSPCSRDSSPPTPCPPRRSVPRCPLMSRGASVTATSSSGSHTDQGLLSHRVAQQPSCSHEGLNPYAPTIRLSVVEALGTGRGAGAAPEESACFKGLWWRRAAWWWLLRALRAWRTREPDAWPPRPRCERGWCCRPAWCSGGSRTWGAEEVPPVEVVGEPAIPLLADPIHVLGAECLVP